MTNNERIAEWLGWTVDKFLPPTWYFKDGDSVMRVKDFKPDTDITLWHGENGLLAEIKRRELHEQFLEEVSIDMSGGGLAVDPPLGWLLLCAKAEQLATSLVYMIDE